MSDYFSNSHVMNIGEVGSLGPAVSPWQMVQQNFRQQYRVDSAFALDAELQTRWLESLAALRTSGQNFNQPSLPHAYQQYARFVREGVVPTSPDVGAAAGLSEQQRLRFGFSRPGGAEREFEEMRRANEAIRQLNNPRIKTFEQILEEVSQMQRGIEEETASMSARAGTFGNIVGFAGSIAGSFTLRDPLNIVTAPIGGGRTVAMRVATDMAVAGGTTAVTEFTDVAPNRALAGLPERDPFLNIAASTIGAGLIRGGIEGAGYGVRSTDWYQQRQALRELESMDFDARDTALRAMLETQPQSPSARGAVSLLDDTTFIERNNPYGEGYAAQERFIAELRAVQRSMNGEAMTAVGRVLPPVPFEYIQKAADFEIVREQAPLVYARMEEAQARLADLAQQADEAVSLSGAKVTSDDVGAIVMSLSPEIIKRVGARLSSDYPGTRLDPPEIEALRSAGATPEAILKGELPESYRAAILAKFNGDDPRTLSQSFDRGADTGADAEIRNLRASQKAANKEYQAAYRAVEAEGVRLREKQAAAEAAQQNEASNILAAVSEGRPFVGPLLRYDSVEALVNRINTINDTLDEKAVAAFARQPEGGVREVWLTEDGRIDIGLREPVDPDFRVPTDDGEMSVVDIMRDLQDDVDLVDAVRSCGI